MDAVPDEDLVVPRGLARTIAYARDAAGRRPARDFMGSLASVDLKQLGAQFDHLAATGYLGNTRQFRKERGQIWTFKTRSGARIAAFQQGRVWYLTHGFVKQRDRWPRTELERAERIRMEHLERLRRNPGSG